MCTLDWDHITPHPGQSNYCTTTQQNTTQHITTLYNTEYLIKPVQITPYSNPKHCITHSTTPNKPMHITLHYTTTSNAKHNPSLTWLINVHKEECECDVCLSPSLSYIIFPGNMTVGVVMGGCKSPHLFFSPFPHDTSDGDRGGKSTMCWRVT